MFHVPHSPPERLVLRESRILLSYGQPYHHLQIRILSDDKNAAFLQLVTHECALSRYTNAETRIAFASPRRVDLHLWPFESCARDTKRVNRTHCAPCRTHSSLCHRPYVPMNLHIPIGLNKGIDDVPAIHAEPTVILPRMLVAEMHRNDESAAAFTSHMPLAISRNIVSLEPARSGPPLSSAAGHFDRPE
jgi:hypothetical protein